MAKFVLGFLTAFAIMGLAGLCVVQFGLFDVRASDPHSPPVTWATHTTMIHAVQHAALGIAPPGPIDAQSIEAGLAIYDQNCVACHGGPGTPHDLWANGMTPPPPFLLGAARRWTRPQLYWIVRNGVKMTGMPSWGAALSDQQIWTIAAFLEAMPYLTPTDYAKMKSARSGRGQHSPSSQKLESR